MQWEEIYAFEKILPILTRWQCLNPDLVSNDLKGILQPSYIKKVRTPKGNFFFFLIVAILFITLSGLPSYEIIWSDPEEHFMGLIPKEQIGESNTTPEKLWSTIEPQSLVNKAYPKLVDKYQQSKIKPKKITKRKKKDVNIEELGDMLKNTSISEPKPKRTRKPTNKKEKNKDELKDNLNGLKLSKTNKKNTLLDNFLRQAVLNNQQIKNKEEKVSENKEIEDEIEVIDVDNCHTSTPSKSFNNCRDKSCFGDEDDDEDLSLIIENIISKKPTNLQLGDIFKGLQFNEDLYEEVDEKQNMDVDLLEKIEKHLDVERNHSSFFITGPVENDLFERTFNELNCSDESDNTVEYDYNELEFDDDETKDFDGDKNKGTKIVGRKNENECKSERLNGNYDNIKKIDSDREDDDSFCDIYVPLLDRLKNK